MRNITFSVDEKTSCWICTHPKPNTAGYPSMFFDGKGTSVHHHIYEAIHGKLINGFIVRHTCDNPL